MTRPVIRRLDDTRWTFFLVICSLFALAAHAEPRTALVIGNSAYTTVSKLKNPVNDAWDVAAKLRRLGFRVTLLTNADQAKMEAAVRKFGTAVLGANKDKRDALIEYLKTL